MPRTVVVFDSSVVIPLILSASRSTRLFLRLHGAGWELAMSPQIFEEVRSKLLHKEPIRCWLKLSDAHINRFLTTVLPSIAGTTPGLRQAHGAVPADPKDDRIIAAALEADASYIITEDKHLLDLGAYLNITIMNREEFARELDRLGVP
jgi:putative PIN family toxin of toxin-antitoxin system